MSNEKQDPLKRIEQKVDVICDVLLRLERIFIGLPKDIQTMRNTDGDFRRFVKSRLNELAKTVAEFVQRTR